MKKFTLNTQRQGQSAKAIEGYSFDTKQEAVEALHNYCFNIADQKDAIYHYSDKEGVRLEADAMGYSDILSNPKESDDGLTIDVYGYFVEEVEIEEEEEA